MAGRAQVTDELTTLVTTEQRGYNALALLTMTIGFLVAVPAMLMFHAFGTFVVLGTMAVALNCARRSSALRKLLVRRNEIEKVERITSRGRPALLVRFIGGGSVTLPTWNHDRERVFTLLSTRELPQARLLK
jgi:hypothetical protein